LGGCTIRCCLLARPASAETNMSKVKAKELQVRYRRLGLTSSSSIYVLLFNIAPEALQSSVTVGLKLGGAVQSSGVTTRLSVIRSMGLTSTQNGRKRFCKFNPTFLAVTISLTRLMVPMMPAEADDPLISIPQGDDAEGSSSSAGSRSTDCPSDDLLGGTGGGGPQADLVKAQQDEIAKAESRSVRSLKAIVLVVLVLSAVGVALSVYFYTSTTEQAQFEAGYEGDVTKVFDGIGRSIEGTLVALDTFQTTIASEARSTGQRWPFVTVPDFSARATKTRLQSDGFSISYSVLVKREQKSEWEAYAHNRSGWVNESMQIQEHSPYYYGPVMYEYNVSDVIWTDTYYETEPAFYLPSWQTDPSTSKGGRGHTRSGQNMGV
jgi:hypothetical protein